MFWQILNNKDKNKDKDSACKKFCSVVDGLEVDNFFEVNFLLYLFVNSKKDWPCSCRAQPPIPYRPRLHLFTVSFFSCSFTSIPSNSLDVFLSYPFCRASVFCIRVSIHSGVWARVGVDELEVGTPFKAYWSFFIELAWADSNVHKESDLKVQTWVHFSKYIPLSIYQPYTLTILHFAFVVFSRVRVFLSTLQNCLYTRLYYYYIVQPLTGIASQSQAHKSRIDLGWDQSLFTSLDSSLLSF